MKDIEAFDAEVTEVGGLYRPGSAPPETENRVLTLFGWLVNHAKVMQSEANCEFRPYFGLIANRDFNAVAFRNHLGASCVGLYFGAIQALDGLFCRIFADPRTLSPIGKPEDEIEVPLLPANYLEVLTDPAIAQPYPRCATRRWWADACTKQALRFLLRHELVHIAHGHIDFLAALQGRPLVTELAWDQRECSDTFLDRQALEFDADCCAASWWCGVFLDQFFPHVGIHDPKNLTDDELDSKVLPDLRGAFFQWAFSVSALFRLFGDAGFAGSDLWQAAYPPLRLRQVVVMRTALDHLRQRWNQRLGDGLAEAVWNGLDVAERTIELVTGSGREVEGLRDAIGRAGGDHINSILAHWESSLRPRLLPYSRGGYLPPPATTPP